MNVCFMFETHTYMLYMKIVASSKSKFPISLENNWVIILYFKAVSLILTSPIHNSNAAFQDCRLTENGTEYKGNIAVTKSGAKCRSSCRNPDGKKQPWCYVEGGDWEYCDIPFCKRKCHNQFTNYFTGGISFDTFNTFRFRHLMKYHRHGL